jgi:hypothetical protein
MNAKTQNEKALDTRDLVEAWARERLLTGGSKPRSIRSDKYRVMRFIHFIEAESLDLAYVDEQTIWNYQGSLLEKKHAHHDKSLGKKDHRLHHGLPAELRRLPGRPGVLAQ